MINALKSEFRKLLTIRSTYIISGLALAISVLVTFYFLGVKIDDQTSPLSSVALQSGILNTLTFVGILAGIVSILSICHEYRYNTIAYSLTITNRRLKVLLAKFAMVAAYAIVMGLLTMLIVLVFLPLGVKMGHATFVTQDFNFMDILWRTLAYMLGSVWIGMVLGFLFRSLVFAIVVYFLLPTTIEPLLANMLKVNANWLPNTAQGHIIGVGEPPMYSPLASLGVLALYLVVSGTIAAVLFVRRDAN